MTMMTQSHNDASDSIMKIEFYSVETGLLHYYDFTHAEN